MKGRRLIWSFLILLPVALAGQGEDQFLPTELKQLTVITEPVTLRKGFFRLTVHGFQNSSIRFYDDSREKILTEGNRMGYLRGTGLDLDYGITDRIQVNAIFPFRFDKIESMMIINDPLTSDQFIRTDVEKAYGISDISLGLAWQVLQEAESRPSLTAYVSLEMPSGRKEPADVVEDSLTLRFKGSTGNGEFALNISLRARKIIYPFSVEFFSGVDYGFGGEKSPWPGEEAVSFKPGMIFFTQPGLNFHLNDWICVTNDLSFQYFGKDRIAGETQDLVRWNLQWVPYIHFQVKRLRLAQGITVPLAGRNMVADPSYLILISYLF
jgi:hypothetical protein